MQVRTRKLSIPVPGRAAEPLSLWLGMVAGSILFLNLWLLTPAVLSTVSTFDSALLTRPLQHAAAIAAWPRGDVKTAFALNMLQMAGSEPEEHAALTLLKQGLTESPANAEAWQTYAEHLFEKSQVERSLAALSISFLLSPNYSERTLGRLQLASRLCGSADDEAATIIKHDARVIALKYPHQRPGIVAALTIASPAAHRLLMEALDLR